MALKEDLLHLLRTDEDLRDAVRRELLSEELLSLPALMRSLTLQVEALTQRLDRMAAVQEGMSTELRSLSEWRRGDEGRRAGERYEQDTVRHALALFGGGRSAVQRPEDLDRLQRALEPLVSSAEGITDAEDPFLADVLWLKGERVAVVEVSIRVDRWDVERADRRAATLRLAGVPALAVVIGQGWTSTEARDEAAGRPVAWRVGDELSAEYVEFRRAPRA